MAAAWHELTQAEKEAAVIDARRRGLSAKLIAQEFQGATRNAILGTFWRIADRARRAGQEVPLASFRPTVTAERPKPFVERPEPRAPKRAPGETARVLPAAAPIAAVRSRPRQPETLQDPATSVTWLDRPIGGCQWPIGPWDGVPLAEKRCCGAPHGAHPAYCPFHAEQSAPRAAQVPPAAKRKREEASP